MLKGSCLCGGVRYEIDGEIGPVNACRCGLCRKMSGSAFSVALRFLRRRFVSLPGKI